MRSVIVPLALLAAVASASFAQTRSAPPALERAVLGSWRSPDPGLDFPAWMVNTYAADGTVQIDFFSKPRGKEIHHEDKARLARWRVRNNALEVGKVDDAGTFTREGQPRAIKTDSSGKVVSIGGWTRVAPAPDRSGGGTGR